MISFRVQSSRFRVQSSASPQTHGSQRQNHTGVPLRPSPYSLLATAPWGGGSESCAPPPPRCARRVTSWHRGCNSEHVPAVPLVTLGSRNENSNPISTPRTKIPTGPGKTCRYFGSCGRTQILARRKGVLGVVLRALYGDGASHSRFQCSEILIFWSPPGHARGKWREPNGRCARGAGVA